MMKLQESGEDYLESILKIEQKKGTVRSVDVANDLQVSKPSVSRAIHVLEDEGLLSMDENARLILTEKGRAIAEKIYCRHLFIHSQLDKKAGEQNMSFIDFLSDGTTFFR